MHHSLPKLGVTAILTLMLAGCMPPDLGPLGEPRAELEQAGDAQAAYPQADWWRSYGDPQLTSLIEEGLKNAPSIAEAGARLRKAEAAAKISGSALLPTVSGDASVEKLRQSYNNGVPPDFVPKGFQDTARATVNFDYEFDFWGKNSDALDAALSDAEAARLQTAQARIMLSTSIANAYASLAQLYADHDAAASSVDVRGKTSNLFGERFTNGLENQGGVEQAKANQASAEAEIAALDEQIALAKNAIAALIGAPPSRAATIARPQVAQVKTLGIPASIPVDLIGRRPDVQAARKTLEANAKRINVARAGFYPNINLTAYFGHQSLGLNTFWEHGSLIGAFGPAIHLPIFEGDKLEGNFRGARADYDAALAQYESTIVQALHEVADASTSLNALDVRTKKTQAALDAAERAYGVANDRYRGGLSTYIEVLRAEDSLIATRRAMADIRARAFTLDVALVKALGGGFMPAAENTAK